MSLSHRSVVWKWWVCGLLLLATMLNYMDRLTLNQTADRIKDDFGLSNTEYGTIEAVFAIAFAVGALGAGWMADRFNVQVLYPAALVLWSLSGFATAFSRTFFELLLFRFLLGLFESGNWPCALRTTQRILPPSERPMGNGILQSGASLGAIVTPLIVLFFLRQTGNWRYPFMAVGVAGSVWVVLWLLSVRRRDLALPDWDAEPPALSSAGLHTSLWDIVNDRRFYLLALIVVSINAAWHFFRAWLPLFLKEAHGYDEDTRQWFSSAYYLAADAGALVAGFAALRLTRTGFSVHRSKLIVFLACAVLTTLSAAAAVLPRGPLLLGVLLVIGFGSLGCFPGYYSLSQELTLRHQGKLTGMLGCISWFSMALLQWSAGRSIDATGSYTLGVAAAGFTPLIGWLGLALFWKEAEPLPQKLPPLQEQGHFAEGPVAVETDVSGRRPA
jgi:ACS family hexuronate transporter-like MFS transporter